MTIETENDILKLKTIGKIVADTLKLMISETKVGMTTLELDQIGAAYLEKFNARSAPKFTYNFPGSTCISVNEDIAHGIPGGRILREGDIINIDVSAELDGYFADTGGSFVLGKSSDIQKKVMRATREALESAINVASAGKPINLIGKAIEKVAKKYNLKIIENLGSHGVGRALHEEPSFIPSFYDPNDRRLLKEGQVITIEPFLSTKTKWVEEASDGWTLFTTPGSVSAQYEHSMIITKQRPVILT
jgi:methionyl aminopeptidase